MSQFTDDDLRAMKEEVEEEENTEVVSEEEQLKDEENQLEVQEVEPIDLSPIFGEDLSEEFRVK